MGWPGFGSPNPGTRAEAFALGSETESKATRRLFGMILPMDKSWRDLRVGDRIRLVAMPSEFAQSGYLLPPCTRRVYERLIARRRPVRIYRIDEWGLPWVRCNFREEDGRRGYHSLAFNHDGWERVRRRS